MDWEDKFTTIVRETERNLAKAKEKLSGKAQIPLSYSSRETLKYNVKSIPKDLIQESSSQKGKKSMTYLDSGKVDTSFSNMSVSSIQVLHMQEQIDSQNRTIEKLKHLVKSLDDERDFYKEQIALLKGEVDLLTSSMRNKSSSKVSELKMSNAKREVMDEVEKVKSLVKSFENDSARRSFTAPSPRFDPEFWNIKENLTSSLEHVRFELNEMKGRIDRMESQLEVDNRNRLKFDTLTEPKSKPLYKPTTKVFPSVTESDLQHLRMAISSINSKLDNIERKCERGSGVYDEGNLRPSKQSPRFRTYCSSLPNPTDNFFLDDDLNSLSDPSDLSNISEDNETDNDFDDGLSDFDLENVRPTTRTITSSILKKGSLKKDQDEFDLSDLELSDVEEADEVDFDKSSFDLN